MDVPYGACSCLFSGILNKIEWIKSQIKVVHDEPYSYIERYYNEVVEAIEFYNKHCVASGSHLTAALEELTPLYKQYMKIE